jgi:hypothetical protein
MKATLLVADLDELERVRTTVDQAFARGLAAIGSRPTHDRVAEAAGGEAAVEELVHIYAEAYAQMRLLQFAYTSKARSYEESKGRYRAVEDDLFDARRHVVPALRGRLGQVKEREATLARELDARGVPAETIGPIVPAERAQETSLRPGEGPIERQTLPPLAPRPPFLQRLRRKRPDAAAGRRGGGETHPDRSTEKGER